jgi:hypothetical protein
MMDDKVMKALHRHMGHQPVVASKWYDQRMPEDTAFAASQIRSLWFGTRTLDGNQGADM